MPDCIFFRPNVVGPGGVLLPQRQELAEMVDDEHIQIMCFTWNINSKSVRSLEMLSDMFQKMEPRTRPDVISIALQELPASTVYFHSDMVAVVEKALKDTHRVYCWVRKVVTNGLDFHSQEVELICIISRIPISLQPNDWHLRSEQKEQLAFASGYCKEPASLLRVI
ncbi:IPPc domain-containing protein [Aphelenchoides bicaudatus]|nr:IPPc domain-containing protein [Aphelenchoides bicaudatus]